MIFNSYAPKPIVTSYLPSTTGLLCVFIRLAIIANPRIVSTCIIPNITALVSVAVVRVRELKCFANDSSGKVAIRKRSSHASSCPTMQDHSIASRLQPSISLDIYTVMIYQMCMEMPNMESYRGM